MGGHPGDELKVVHPLNLFGALPILLANLCFLVIDDWALTYGAGTAAVVRALEIRSHQGRSLFSLNMEIGVRYSKGGTAEYLREGSIHREQGTLLF